MAKKFMYVSIGILVLVVAVWLTSALDISHRLIGLAGQPLFVSLVTVLLGGLFIQRLALAWQHDYWNKQHEITRAKEIRDIQHSLQFQAYKQFIGAYYRLLGAELQEKWNTLQHPTPNLTSSWLDFATARDLALATFEEDSEAYRLLTRFSSQLKALTKEIAIDDQARTDYIEKRHQMIHGVLIAMMKILKLTA